MQNGIAVNAADEVTVDGFMARDYKSNGFFFTNLTGYTMNHLIARQTGVYGLYAFNTIGGRMLNSEAYYVNDGAFYIGQTPPQAKPVRTIVRNVEGWGSPLGFSATNMRYVTITKSRFYNNAAGIVPNALDSEKFPPPEDNAIIDNDIFWNNFNYHQGKPPFTVRKDGNAALVPIGTGILLLGGRDHRIENNRIHGNFLTGVAAIEGVLLQKNPEAKSLERNVVRNNQFGRSGTDANGTDLMYDGNGSDNCWSLDGVNATFPADRSTFAGCGGPNAFSPRRPGADAGPHGRERAEGVGQAPAPRHQGLHAARGLRVRVSLIAVLAGAALLCAVPAQGAARKTVAVGDNYYAPEKLTVKQGHHGHVALAGLRGGRRRPRREARLRPEEGQEVPLRGGVDGLLVQAQAHRAGQVPDRVHAPRGDAHDDQGAEVDPCGGCACTAIRCSTPRSPRWSSRRWPPARTSGCSAPRSPRRWRSISITSSPRARPARGTRPRCPCARARTAC